MMVSVSVKTYSAPPINGREILRYAGTRQADEALNALVDECVAEAQDALNYRVCYCILPITACDKHVDFGFAVAESRDLAKNLRGATHAVIFCATVGIGIDRLANKYGSTSPAKSLVFQALGSERVECLADLFCEELACTYAEIRPRFSPGYGDFGVEFQRRIFEALNVTRHLGVALSDSMIMSPTKTVTAIVGVR